MQKTEGKQAVFDEQKYTTTQANKIPSVVTVSTPAVEEHLLNNDHNHYLMLQYTPMCTNREERKRKNDNR